MKKRAKVRNTLSEESLNKLSAAGAYGRTIDKLTGDHCYGQFRMYGLSNPLTNEDIEKMTVEEIFNLINTRYA